MPKERPLIIRQLHHDYDHQPVLTDINFELNAGEFFSILGASGCGKSTLLRVIAGLTKAKSGEIILNGKTVFADGQEYSPVEHRRVGFVFQDFALFPFMNVRENIAFGLNDKNKKRQQARVNELLEVIDMQAFAERKPSQLSGGQQQRVALARALAPRPRVLLLDEPFANVDAALRQSLGDQLQMLVRQEGVSVILVTHDRNEALSLADRVAVLQQIDGQGTQLIQCDSPERIYHCPMNQAVAELTGSVNFIRAQAHGNIARTAFGQVRLRENAWAQGYIVVRPEMAHFKLNQQGTARVKSRLFQGHSYRLLCDTPHGEIHAYSSSVVPIGERGDIIIEQACWLIVD